MELGHLSLMHLCGLSQGMLLTKNGGFLTIDDPQLGQVRVTPSFNIRDNGGSGGLGIVMIYGLMLV